jgi:N-acetyl-anhydromuramyl-L-alanine amidase AmpD
LATIEKGLMVDKSVEVKTYPSIEHGALLSVTSIVLHRTDSSTAASVLNAYKSGQKTGAHFLIEKDGKIYQTASLERICWHVGILQPRCVNESTCDPTELKNINALLHQKGLSFSKRARNVSSHENTKAYPLRYPANSDSVGIEVVGRFLPSTKDYEAPTQSQLFQTKWLTQQLVDHYKLKLLSDVYSHGAIARKEATEGAQLLRYIFTGA